MRVAIIHYWLVGMRGGEKVVEQLCRIYPEADIFTHVVDKRRISTHIARRVVGTTFISRLPFANRLYKLYLPLMPCALEQLDLRGYDLVISSESGPAKGVLVAADALHICYCHSPMRYIWAFYHEYLGSASRFERLGLRLISHYMRISDLASAARVDVFIANSRYVARRIKRCYNREATVIYPPVDIDNFRSSGVDEVGDFYLMVGELVAYKRFDLGIAAAMRLGRRLVIVGSGQLKAQLQRNAGPNVVFLGAQPDEDLRRLYSTCRALLFPGEEDFGIVPVEAMAAGRPVIAFRKGGAVESVKSGVTGLFFDHQSVDSLVEAVQRFESQSWDSEAIRVHATAFSAKQFRTRMRNFLDRSIQDRGAASGEPNSTSKPRLIAVDSERESVAGWLSVSKLPPASNQNA